MANNSIMKKLGLILLFALIATAGCFGQAFTLVGVTAAPTDLTASTSSRLDLNGRKCALVKVRCVLDGLTFQGNVMGAVEQKDGEYYVYMTDGTKRLDVHHPRVLPIEIDLAGTVGPLVSAATYSVVLSIPDALYAAVVGTPRQESAPVAAADTPAAAPKPDNTVLTGTVLDERDGEPLIGCNVIIQSSRGNRGTVCDIDGNFRLEDVRPGSTVRFEYVGCKHKEITFTGKIPQNFTVKLKAGRGTQKGEYFYDPDDRAEYFDLNGNRLPQRPTSKGTYLRIVNGKPEKFTVK